MDGSKPPLMIPTGKQRGKLGFLPLEPWNQIVVVKRQRLFYEMLEPVDSWETQGYRVFDFGKEISAFPRFHNIGPQGGSGNDSWNRGTIGYG